LRPVTVPLAEPVRIWHLLTHMSGLTYGFMHAHPCDAMLRAAGWEWGSPEGLDLAAACDQWASMPLLFQPGTEWNYGFSTDVLGRVVEVVSGMSLDRFFTERIFEPLGMVDTGFALPESERHRLAALYIPDPATQKRLRFDPLGAVGSEPPTFLSGGGGLVGTASDYLRFAEMLRGGGELDGVRLLGTRTVDYMTSNHLPGGVDLEAIGRPLFSETTFDGVGFGFAMSVTIDSVKSKVLGSDGEFGWGGAASTAFWVDPVEDLTVLFLTQLLPSSTWPIRPQLKQLVHQALVD
jgi:CubicO group peptidase (beta-lactamase class C family)